MMPLYTTAQPDRHRQSTAGNGEARGTEAFPCLVWLADVGTEYCWAKLSRTFVDASARQNAWMLQLLVHQLNRHVMNSRQ